ncbi:uncharacterized protein LOC117173549 [Belonocnema kinseyi]|uniref:uncharacterized protein LOC117173549 n=1 Tax=Belonocnema kinseyi TaxID=2817044 RepID=UPI00143CEEFD|nr:uncharacterized protein LOC117173549 [Belonocnema kinseyi]
MSDKESVVRKDAMDRDAPERANNSETGSRSESESVDLTVVEQASSQANGSRGPGAELGETSTPIRSVPENRKSYRENKGLPPQRYGYVSSEQKGRGGWRGGTSRRTRGGMAAAPSQTEQARPKSADLTAGKLTAGQVQFHHERRAESERLSEHSHRSVSEPGSKSITSEISVSSSIAHKRRELRQAEELDRLEEAERKRLERKKTILKMHSELAELEEADMEENKDQCSRKAEDSKNLVKSKVLAGKESEGNNNEDEQLMRRQDQERRSHSFPRQTRTTTKVTGFEKYLARQAMTKDLPSFSGECLKGAALEAVRALLMTDREDEVTETLERRFGRPEYVIKDLMPTVQALGKPQYLNNLMFVDLLVAKLPLAQKLQWAAVCEQETDVSNIAVFAQWIRRQANLVSNVYDPSVDKLESKMKKGAVIGAVLDKNNESVKCVYCEKDHHVSKCEAIKDVSVDERWNWATKKRLCFSCLKPLHSIRDCRRRRCNKDGCPKRHHPLLHTDGRRSTETASRKTDEEVFPEKVHINVVQRRKRHVFMRVLPVVLKGPAGEIDTYAYLDCGSSVTVIDAELARNLGLRGKLAPLEAEWTNGVTLSEPTSRQVNLTIRGPSDREFTLTDVQTQNTLNLPRSTVKIDTDVWQHLRGLPLSDILHAQPRILIGEDHGELLVARKSVFGPGNSPMASLTALGWVVHGKCKIDRAEPEYVMFYHRTENDDISQRMTDFWNTETFGVNPTATRLRSKEDQRAEELINRTARRDRNKWEAGLLCKTDNETLPPSRKMAEKRFVALERKMDRDPAFRHEYEKKIQDYQEKGYALRLTKEEAAQSPARTWYLPHFAVFNANKPGKICLVFDAAAKSHGVSLNDRLLKGPDLLGSLVGVLFRFRERAIAIGGDLKEMFHQVRIRKEDRCSQRILGRDKDTNEIFVFEMQVMIFGAVSSPYVA